MLEQKIAEFRAGSQRIIDSVLQEEERLNRKRSKKLIRERKEVRDPSPKKETKEKVEEEEKIETGGRAPEEVEAEPEEEEIDLELLPETRKSRPPASRRGSARTAARGCPLRRTCLCCHAAGAGRSSHRARRCRR